LKTHHIPSVSSSGALSRSTGFFGEKADSYAQKYGHDTPAGLALRTRRQRVLELFDKPNGTILDVGCGPAEMVRDLLNRNCEFWGVDPSPRMIEICLEKYSGNNKAHFRLGEAERLEFPDASFDAVLCMGVIDALDNASQAVSEMVRVLKPGGSLIISFSNRHSPYAWWKAFVYYRALALIRRVLHPNMQHDPIFVRRRLFTAKTASELLAKTGAPVERVVGYFYNLLLSPLDEIWPAATLRLNRRLEERRDGKMDWLAAGFIVKAVKAPDLAEALAPPAREQ
jgi:ubiquinone/menaquinone biosynthesis C-methylase UbiE